MKRIHVAALSAALLAGFAGCASSPDSKFYTLQPDVSAGAVPAAPSRTPPLLIEVLPVQVPQQVQRPQMVLADGEGRVTIDEYHRWASSVDDEVRQAVSIALGRDLGALDVYRTPVADSAPRYRINVAVQRFDSAPDRHIALTAVWSVRRQPGNAALTCRTAIDRPVGNGFSGLVEGHRQAVAQLASEIGSGILALDQAAREQGATNTNAVGTNVPAMNTTATGVPPTSDGVAVSRTSVPGPASDAATAVTAPPIIVPPCPVSTR